jgi:predicted DsbA family dithiol-disulfide isomerase
MSTNPPPGQSGVGRRFEEAIDRFEKELQNAVKYMNDRVVPEVRRESITAMRRMAETLGNLADRMEKRTPQAATKTEGRQH